MISVGITASQCVIAKAQRVRGQALSAIHGQALSAMLLLTNKLHNKVDVHQ